MLITLDEESNIERTLDKLQWARRIVVIDSGSTDTTLTLLRSYPQVDVFSNPFIDFASQCNYGLGHVTSPWVLSLDADYELSDALVTELASLRPSDTTSGYRASFVYRIHGRPLRNTLYPPRAVLYRKDKALYQSEGHGHRVIVRGDVLPLRGRIYHDDRKPLGRWLKSQQRYAREEAAFLLGPHSRPLGRADRLRLRGWPAPLLVLFYTLLVKGCVLDGWPGFYYGLQRTIAEVLIALEIIDHRLRGVSRAE